jgi:hypothetical protein
VALKRAPAAYVATLLVPATLVTNVLSAVFVTHAFTGRDLMSTVLYVLGIALVVLFSGKAALSASKSFHGALMNN